MPTNRPNLLEIASIRGSRDITRGYVAAIGDYLPTQDELLLLKSGGDLKLYEQVAADDQVKSCLQQRFRAVISKEWEVLPGGEKRIDKQAAEYVKAQLMNIDWDGCTEKMLWGVHYGFSAAEVMWKKDGDKVGIADIRVRDRRRFWFDADQKLTLRTFESPLGEVLPERKFWHFSVGADHDDEPYGRGLAHWLYWPTFFKRNGVRWWLRYLELFASPARKGIYPAGATRQEKDVLWHALASFGQDDRMMIPEGLDIEFLESSRNGAVDYKALCDQMDAAIAKIILSQTMTTDNGSSRSQAEVHEGVAESVTESDADLICGSFNNSVVKWLTDWNFPGAAYPKVWRKLQSDPDVGVLADADTKLQGLGISLKPEAIATKYGDDYFAIDNNASPQMTEGQVNALISTVSSAKQGGWTPELLQGIINVSFPGLSDEAVAAITSNLGELDKAQFEPYPNSTSTSNLGDGVNLDDVAAQFAAKVPGKKKQCKAGISCGNACISAAKTCRKALTDEQKEMKPPIVASAGGKPKAEAKAKAEKPKNDVDKKLTVPKVEEPKVEPKAKAEAAKDIKGLQPQLLSMANGADLDTIEISSIDIKYARQKFMDKQDDEFVENKISRMKTDAPNLSDDEALALSTWIGYKYASMNAVLYGGKIRQGDFKSVETTDLLAAKALYKLRPATKEQITSEAEKKNEPYDSAKPLGRYMTVPNPEEFVKRYQDALAGDGEIRESTFFATSHIDRADFNFCTKDTNLTYEVKPRLDGKGSGRYIDHYKNTASEGELLYPPETKFRVLAVIPPQVTGKFKKPKEYQFTPQELQDKADYDDLNSCAITAYQKTNAASGKLFQTELAKAYQEKTGKPLPSKAEQKVIESKSQAVTDKEMTHSAAIQKIVPGKDRNRNWIIQLEEI